MKLLLLIMLSFSVYAGKISVRRQVSGTATSTASIAAPINLSRCYLLIQNKGSVDIYAKFETANSGIDGVKIVAGGNYEPFMAPLEALYVKTSSSTSDYEIIEGNCI